MHISVVSRKTHDKKDTLFLPYTQDFSSILKRFNIKDAKFLEEYVKDTQFGMDNYELFKLPEMGNTVLLCGLKEVNESISSAIRKYHKRTSNIVFDIDMFKSLNIDDETLARIITNATVLGSYNSNGNSTILENGGLKQITINAPDDQAEWYRKLFDVANENVEATLQARMFGNSSLELETTDRILDEMKKNLGRKFKTKIYRAKDIRAFRYRGLSQLSDSSSEEPVMVIAEHKPDRGKTIAVCASLILHPFQTTIGAKSHMLPLGIIRALSAIHSNAEKDTSMVLIFTINRLKETASLMQKPIKLASGSSYEISSRESLYTIALSDAIFAASRYKPRQIISINSDSLGFSSFLGGKTAAYLSNSEVSTQLLDDAGNIAMESVFRLPMTYSEDVTTGLRKNYRLVGSERIESWLQNARILEVNASGYPWMHIDLSVNSYSEESKGTMSKGSTGFGAALINEYLKILSKKI
jgi:leucyl aminopeptidase